MTTTAFELVGNFHVKFGHPVETVPVIPDPFNMKLRINLIIEELKELVEAMHANSTIPDSVLPNVAQLLGTAMNLVDAAPNEEFAPDIFAVADALSDILYVANGAGHVFGIDLDACLEEVHRSNMSKLGADGMPIYNEKTGKIMKGPDYSEPDLVSILYPEGDVH